MDCLTLTLNTEVQNRKFMVPYKNEDGYYACLFGENLIYDELKGRKTIIIVESEKTAVV